MTEKTPPKGGVCKKRHFVIPPICYAAARAQVLIILTFDPAIEQLAALIRLAAEVMLKLLGRAEREEGPGRK